MEKHSNQILFKQKKRKMKKSMNLLIALSLTLFVGLTFFVAENQAKAMVFADVPCTDCFRATDGDDLKRLCGPDGDCPWKFLLITSECTVGTCDPWGPPQQ